jgi:hypothetical protein
MSPEDTEAGGMLTSWKEVAAFFKRQVRTVQRWERGEGLPIHRHPHRRRSSIYAYPSELEAWWHAHQASAAADADPPPRQPRLIRAGLAVAACAVLAAGAWSARGLVRAREAAPPFPVQRPPQFDGASLSALTDVNGDGRADALTHADTRGEMHLYFGGWPPRAGRTPDVRLTAALGELSGGAVGDVDGDGLIDLALVAVFSEPEAWYGTPPIYLIRGRSQWPSRLELPRDADSTFTVDDAKNVAVGVCYPAHQADLNADGVADLILGGVDYSPPGRISAGGVWVLFGRRDWSKRVDVVAAADITIHGSRTGEGLSPRCDAGDFNGDGRRDLAVVALEHTLWFRLGARGRYYVFAGRPEWPRVLEAEADALLRVDGETPMAVHYIPLNPLLADVDGDGIDDMITALEAATPTTSGLVAVTRGGPRVAGVRRQSAADIIVAGTPGSRLGAALAAADFDGDRAADLIVAEPDAGSVWLIPGRRDWPRRASPVQAGGRRVLNRDPWQHRDNVAVGDFEGDGTLEIALAAGGPSTGAHRIDVVTPYAALGVDIRPGEQPNIVLTHPGSVLAVRVSSRSAINLRDIDVSTATLAGLRPFDSAWQDFDNDGRPDLQLYFDAAALRIRPGATRLALLARLRGGLPAAGADQIAVGHR